MHVSIKKEFFIYENGLHYNEHAFLTKKCVFEATTTTTTTSISKSGHF
jgi:hypothetical protein